MSAIASFYVIPAERLPEMLAAATPQTAGWFRAARDTFPGALRSAARELDVFAWSGWAFNTLDLYLESRHGFMIDTFGDTAASEQLTKARGSSWLVLPATGAAGLLAALESVVADDADVIALATEEHGSGQANEEAAAVQAALATLKSWLREVLPGTVGLHSVG